MIYLWLDFSNGLEVELDSLSVFIFDDYIELYGSKWLIVLTFVSIDDSNDKSGELDVSSKLIIDISVETDCSTQLNVGISGKREDLTGIVVDIFMKLVDSTSITVEYLWK